MSQISFRPSRSTGQTVFIVDGEAWGIIRGREIRNILGNTVEQLPMLFEEHRDESQVADVIRYAIDRGALRAPAVLRAEANEGHMRTAEQRAIDAERQHVADVRRANELLTKHGLRPEGAEYVRQCAAIVEALAIGRESANG